MEGPAQLAPEVRTPLPGALGARLVDTLAATESPAFTARRARREERSGAAHDPIVWTRASGINVWDVDGNRYVDMSAGFGASAIGHSHPDVVTAVQAQSGRLLHALGDVYPADVKVRLLERLAGLLPCEDARVLLGLGGSDAVTAALKTAVLATGRSGVLAFEGGYHGLGYGPLAVCGYSAAMREPFARQLNPDVRFAPYPGAGTPVAEAIADVTRCFEGAEIGAVIIEPVLGRGGAVVPPPGFLAALAELARERGALLVADEVLTGLGRTGAFLRAVSEGVVPDLVCIGKALGGGLPVSACIGSLRVMRAWGAPGREAIHTGTFFGHPLGCVAALAVLDAIEREQLCEAAAARGAYLRRLLAAVGARHACVREVRGAGLLVGVELDGDARVLGVVRALLERGYVTLPAGRDGRVLSLTPPLVIAEERLDEFVQALDAVLGIASGTGDGED